MSRPRSKIQEVSLLASQADDFYATLLRSGPLNRLSPGDRAIRFLVCSLISDIIARERWETAQILLTEQARKGVRS